MKSSEVKSIIKKGDVAIIISVVLVSLIWFVSGNVFSSEKKEVNVCRNGEVLYSFELSSLEGEEIVEVNSCKIRITKDGACFLSSDCPDGLCVRRGMMTKAGDVMACVPEGVTVHIKNSRSDIDGISY